jgi:mRNA-degrading endonuclease RelE of RelBE toxin-antitoxin system
MPGACPPAFHDPQIDHWIDTGTPLAYSRSGGMVIVETSIFTRQVLGLLSDDEYSNFQVALAKRPEVGPVIEGSGGLRKVRWTIRGRGKRGGVRIIYYWAVEQERLLMLLIYAKAERDDLTPRQIAILRQIVEEEYP